MDDLFADEQKVLDDAILYSSELKAGAPFDPEKYYDLVTEYRRILKLFRLKTKISDRSTINLYESNLDLSDKVHFDSLTEIYNRRYMEDVLKRTIKTMIRTGHSQLSVMMIDIDFFKNYNDTYGHSMGDFCLKAIATTLSSTVTRPDDCVARYGGEEFAVILPKTNEPGAKLVAEKLLHAVRICNILHEKSDVASYVTISIGVTTGIVNASQTGLDYIKRADEALYVSKQNGRDRYTFLPI